uniref:cysteine dioxygenase n=1 Tax=Oryza sativa subsp. japonica TaxID=39947 RepID=Q7XHX7_ORYSJ|nr:HGWP repeat containing protein-like [Oryza sativa Japonica Group]BAD31217.1 HGWP repeat containing protein-like [Oryza sativa Japonica Group]
MGVYDFTAGLPPSPPTGVLAYTVGWSHHRSWASTTSPPACLRRRRLVFLPTRLAYYAAAVGRLRLHRRPASVAADWCPRLYGWLVTPPFMGVYDFTAGLPLSPPSGASAYTAGLLCHRCWASTTSPPACLRRRRLVSSPIRSVGHTTVDGHRHLHRRPASVAAEWCPRLHGWPIMPPLLDVYILTVGSPSLPSTGVSAYTAGLLCHRCWVSTTSPPACLRRRRLVSSPIRLVGHTTVHGRLRLHRRPASVAADWCPRLYGWLVTPPFMGVYDFTAGLPPSPPTGVSAYTAGLLCRRCWASTTSPPACLRCRRLVSSPIRLVGHTTVHGRLRLHRRLASVAAEWCLRLHGWPIMPPLLGVYDFTAGLPPSPPTGVLAYTVGWSHHRSWASTTSPPACLRRRRVVPPPTRLAYYAAVVGCLHPHRWLTFVAVDWIQIQICIKGIHGFKLISYAPGMDQSERHHRLASTAADWCFRLHGRPIMLPLLGVYVFTDRPPRPLPTGVSACTAGLYAAVVGRLRLHRPAASSATDWCFRLHGWPLCRRCWASTSSPTGRLDRRRLVFPPARLAYYAAVVGRLRLHRPAASSAADWCFRLHGWPLCRRCWASTSSPTGRLDRRRLVFPPARLAYYAAVVGRLRLHRPAAASAADWCHRLHGWPVITPTDAIFFTAGYIAVTTNRHQYLQHKLPTFVMAADWFLHFHGCMILPVLIGLTIFIAGRLVCC